MTSGPGCFRRDTHENRPRNGVGGSLGRVKWRIGVLALLGVLVAGCLPGAGNPDGTASVPRRSARSTPRSRPASSAPARRRAAPSAAVVQAVAAGGIITFDCGPDPVTITMTATAKVVNDTGPKIVLDGGGKVTLSGGGRRRILYMNTCDQAQVLDHVALPGPGPPAAHRAEPHLRRRQLHRRRPRRRRRRRDLRARRAASRSSTRASSATAATRPGPTSAARAIRVLEPVAGPAGVRRATAPSAAPTAGQRCSNGGALSSIGVSWMVLNSLFSDNTAIGNGANPAQAGHAGRRQRRRHLQRRQHVHRSRSPARSSRTTHANEGGGAIFFVSNDRTGTLRIEDSTLRRNPSDGLRDGRLPRHLLPGPGQPGRHLVDHPVRCPPVHCTRKRAWRALVAQ